MNDRLVGIVELRPEAGDLAGVERGINSGSADKRQPQDDKEYAFFLHLRMNSKGLPLISVVASRRARGVSEPAGANHIMRGPDGIEFFLEDFEPVEVIKIGPTAIDERAETVPARGKPAAAKAGKRGRAKVKPFVAFLLGKGQQLGEQRIHQELVHIGHVAHQVDRDLILVGTAPYIGESNDFAVFLQHGNIETLLNTHR